MPLMKLLNGQSRFCFLIAVIFCSVYFCQKSSIYPRTQIFQKMGNNFQYNGKYSDVKVTAL